MEIREAEPNIWEVSPEGDMRVPARIYGTKHMIDQLTQERSTEWSALQQLMNVATLPGIQRYALGMSDIHPGYGAPIGGVGAFDMKEGIVNFALTGFDINCGVRCIKLPLKKEDVVKKQKELGEAFFNAIPAGLGSEGELRLTPQQLDTVMVEGSRYALERGYGIESDLHFTEENGRVDGADTSAVSQRARQRALRQIGTLGSGNHYAEVQYVSDVFHEEAAEAYGLEKGGVEIMIHCGSRALGHQIGTDYLETLTAASKKYGLPIRERELVGAPVQSEEGQAYLKAVRCGINAAFCNRQVLTHLTRVAVRKVFPEIKDDEIEVLYDVAHNTAKVEKYGGKEFVIGRKGATRAFGPGNPAVPREYQKVGQPVLIGGTMATGSYILAGTKIAEETTFGSSCHGAGRLLSRERAKRTWRGEALKDEMAKQGILAMGHSWAGLAEEAPGAYKDVDEVVGVMHDTGVSLKVVRARPLIVVKG
jgi:tRNA-splicing ligase RtcB